MFEVERPLVFQTSSRLGPYNLAWNHIDFCIYEVWQQVLLLKVNFFIILYKFLCFVTAFYLELFIISKKFITKLS